MYYFDPDNPTSLNPGFATETLSPGTPGTYITLNEVQSPDGTLLPSDDATTENQNVENSVYYNNPTTTVGSLGGVQYYNYYGADAISKLAANVPPGTQLDYDFGSGDDSLEPVTVSGLVKEFAQMPGGPSGPIVLNDTSTENDGDEYHFSFTPGGATVVSEDPDGAPLSAELAGNGGTVSVSDIPITVDQGSSNTIHGNDDTITAPSDSGQSNSPIASPEVALTIDGNGNSVASSSNDTLTIDGTLNAVAAGGEGPAGTRLTYCRPDAAENHPTNHDGFHPLAQVTPLRGRAVRAPVFG
jgi:hypothetical protein